MCKIQRRYRSSFRPVIFLVLLFSFNVAFPQRRTQEYIIIKIPHSIIEKIRDNITVFSSDSVLGTPAASFPGSTIRDRSIVFMDTLKARASKYRLTKTLYDFVVVNADTIYNKQFTTTSDANYLSYSGKKIRKIVIQRLNVFGADIYNPLSENPEKIEKLLNRTHVNTNETIIRKNLLFSENDSIFPLLLSDNERLLRQLPFIDEARIIVVPVSDREADIIVYTKDVYSLGASFTYESLKKGSISLFDKNIIGMGHEFGLDIPYDNQEPNSPGIGFHYLADNIRKSFINLNIFWLYGLGKKTYGFDLSRKLVSSTTKYAGGISVRQVYTSEDLDTLPVPAPLKFNYQDYWLSRSFLINIESATRIVIGSRYTSNNVFDRPIILPESYHRLQRYSVFLGSVALSIQKYTKTNLIYEFGRSEDIPYGSLFKLTAGSENNEFKRRAYIGYEVSFGKSSQALGYFYFYGGLSAYLNKNVTEQGLLSLGMNYFSNLIYLGNARIRNFVYADYTRGFDRYSDEYLKFSNINGFTGFRNDSVNGTQRLSVSLESVLFSPVNLYGFRFAFFGFTDFSFLSGTNEILGKGYALSSIGLGVRVRNNNLVFKTLQVRIGYFPHPPSYSRISPVNVSGEQLLRPENFESGPPSIIPYR